MCARTRIYEPRSPGIYEPRNACNALVQQDLGLPKEIWGTVSDPKAPTSANAALLQPIRRGT
jgi:hypothetical protein